MRHQPDRSKLSSRYIFSGDLVLDTPLHLGTGGEISTITDSPILRDATGRPVIPGSSFKGAFRATVERLAPLMGSGIRSCNLYDEDQTCLSPQSSKSGEAYRAIRRFVGKEIRSSGGTSEDEAAREAIAFFQNYDPSLTIPTDTLITEQDHILPLLDACLCDTCHLFGSNYLAAKSYFDDLPVVPETWFEITEIRDGVGLDRDSERAVPNIKFDYEVVPSQTHFRFGMMLESPTARQLGLIAAGLQEFVSGMVRLGGIKSRGLGKCHLELDEVRYFEISEDDRSALFRYLRTGELSRRPADEFIADRLDVFSEQEAGNA
jgi:CRISPR-associated RAMP protein (TIGR02581 family)